MIIYINARFVTQAAQGVQRYALELVKGLDALIDQGQIDPAALRFVMLAPRAIRYDPGLKHIPLKTVGRLGGHLWEQLELPRYARGGLLLSLTNTGPIGKADQVVTIHDVSVFAVPEAYSFSFRAWYQFVLKRLARRARGFITVSAFSKKEIVTHLGIEAAKIRVTHEGKEHILAVAPDLDVLRERDLLDKRFVFVVSSMSPHKNFAAVVRALDELAALDLYVVIVGIDPPQVFAPLQVLPSERVIHLGYVSNATLRALYEHAFCFVHPSLYEGFGLPPLEAMACGCPVIVSEAASLPEVCGDAALYFNPHDPAEIAARITQLASDAALREDLVRKSTRHAEAFTWETCARETYAYLASLVQERGAHPSP